MTRHHVWFGVQLVVTLVLLGLLFRRFDWRQFAEVLGRISPGFYVGSLLAVIVGQTLYALRWWIVLGGMRLNVSFGEVLRQYLIGIFFSNLMPTAVGGDAAKVYYLGRQAGFVEVGASVFVDRFLGFLWLAVSGAVLAWLVAAPTPLFVFNRNLLTLFAAIFVALLAIAWRLPVDRLVAARLRAGRFGAVTMRLQQFIGFVRVGGCRPATLAASVGVVFGYIVLMMLIYRWYFATTGAPVPGALQVMNVLVSMAIFVNVPISVNGIGLREQLHYLLFAALGLPKEVSVSIALLIFSHSLLLSLVGYGAWLRARPLIARSAA